MKKVDLLKEFGKHFKKVRKAKGLSIREMELRGDIDRQTISKIESGQQNPTLYSLKRLCEVLEIDMEELFKGFKK